MSMTCRACFLIATCSILGLGLGAANSQAATRQCFTQTSTDDCFTAPMPWAGMGQGFLVGTFAAIGASWQVLKKDRQ